MEKYEINKYLTKFSGSVNDIVTSLNPDKVNAVIKEINEQMSLPDFWNDSKKSSSAIDSLNAAKDKKAIIDKTQESYQDVLDAFDLYQADESADSLELLEELILSFDDYLEKTTVEVILTGDYDSKDAILEIHPGAGGTESNDWADMLLRMYQRYAQKHNFKFKVIDFLAGEEAGVKSVTVLISGKNAYGYLKGESGVHRLVRISPFDTNKRRHTSFASVAVSPVMDNTNEIVVDEKDIRIDTFCSSGPGGQGVNTTYSAVRITHIPTGIVVNCQNERSQLQNREQAMMVLKSKLLDLELKRQEEELAKIKGNNNLISFGSQIRSYVFCPYTLVKDHRTDIENGNVSAVMDGDLDSFIYGYLKWMCKND